MESSEAKAGSRPVPADQVTPDQCRAARGLLDITRTQLAAAARVSLATLYQFENGERAIKRRTQELIRSALEARGVAFIAEDGGGVGVRLRKEGAASRSADPAPAEHASRPVGPEDEVRGGHEAGGRPGPTVPGLRE